MDLKSRVLRARIQGRPFDPARLDLFGALTKHLLSEQLAHVDADPYGQPEFPFFEAYFSNFIEGTEFSV
ncbi:MAG TPA: cell filamentation protein Fic, partial [Chloroflexota bacterium]|nr:cell filamentation protein Fic [Chloroflexota bacterium]